MGLPPARGGVPVNAQPKPPILGYPPTHRPEVTRCKDRAQYLARVLEHRPASTPIASPAPAAALTHACPTRTCLCGLVLGAPR